MKHIKYYRSKLDKNCFYAGYDGNVVAFYSVIDAPRHKRDGWVLRGRVNKAYDSIYEEIEWTGKPFKLSGETNES